MSRSDYSLVLTAIAAFAASPAGAHISLENRQATIGAPYKAVFAVPHGCAGSATIKIRVQIPEGVIAAKPMPKDLEQKFLEAFMSQTGEPDERRDNRVI